MTEGFERIPDRTRDECGDGERAAAPTHPRYENGFGERLRMVREGAGYTQAYLADLCRLPASAISHFESGRRMPSADSLRRVAIGLNVSADVLLDITAAGDREPQPFERYPALASWIERFAGLPLQGISLGDWCVFIGALNSAILRAERGSGSTSVAAQVPPPIREDSK